MLTWSLCSDLRSPFLIPASIWKDLMHLSTAIRSVMEIVLIYNIKASFLCVIGNRVLRILNQNQGPRQLLVLVLVVGLVWSLLSLLVVMIMLIGTLAIVVVIVTAAVVIIVMVSCKRVRWQKFLQTQLFIQPCVCARASAGCPPHDHLMRNLWISVTKELETKTALFTRFVMLSRGIEMFFHRCLSKLHTHTQKQLYSHCCSFMGNCWLTVE